MLSIEVEAPLTIYKVEEVENSKKEEILDIIKSVDNKSLHNNNIGLKCFY